MADIPRAPLFFRQHRRPDPGPSYSVQNLLTSTLFVAAAALPFNNAAAFPAQQQHPSHAKSANADTSKGTPKTLTLDALAPLFDAPVFAPQHPRNQRAQNQDESAGTPQTLMPVALYQNANAPHVGPQHPKQKPINSDTSRQMPQTLLPTGVVVAPFIPAPTLQVDGRRRGDVRSDVAANLQLLFAPDQIATTILDETLPIYRAPVTPTNTSYRNCVALDVLVVLPPFVNPPSWSPSKFWWSADTSQQTPPSLLAVVAVAPFVNVPQFGFDRKRTPTDTSQQSPKALLDVVAAPFFNAPQATPDRSRASVDTSQGTPKALYNDALAPFFNAPNLTPDRIRPVVDTSQTLNAPLAFFVPPAPFSQDDWPAPIAYRQSQVRGWDAQAAVWTIPDALPVPPPTSTGAPDYGGKKKRRYIVRHGDQLLVFTNKADALAIALEDAKPAKAKAKVQKPKPAPVETVQLLNVKAYAELIGQAEQYAKALAAQQNQKLLELYEQMQDDEDIELLLLHDA